MHHAIFDTHELSSDFFVSDTDSDQSLRDMLADGALIQIARRFDVHVDFIALNARENPIVEGFSDICTTQKHCDTYDEVLDALRAESATERTLRIVAIPNEPLSSENRGQRAERNRSCGKFECATGHGYNRCP